MKDTLINTLLFIIAIVAIAGATWYVSPNGSIDMEKEYEVLSEREIIDFVVEEDIFGSVVYYSYIGEQLPEKLAEDEVVEMRTESSFTVLTDILNEDTEEEELILDLVSYSQRTFMEKEGDWYYIEHGEVPKSVFDKITKQGVISKVFGNIAHATTDTIYSDAGDGHVYLSASIWATARDGTTGSIVANTGSTLVTYVSYSTGKTTVYAVERVFLPFDTSSISADATISAATINVYVTATVNDNNDGTDYITVVRTSQADYTDIVLADYDQFGTTEGIATGQRKDITSISAGDLTFTLNSTGIGWIAQSGDASNCSSTNGISCFGFREGHDNADSAPTTTGSNTFTVSSSDETDTDQDPYLSVTYTVPSTFAPWMFHEF